MDKITFENATLVNPAKVTIDGVDYEVTPEETSGGTPASASTFNTMQENIEKSVVAVSKTQPSTSENVWIKKGKNHFDENNITKLLNCTYSNGVVTQSQADTASEIKIILQTYMNETYVNTVENKTAIIGTMSYTFAKNNTFNSIRFGAHGSTLDTKIQVNISDLTDGETYTLSFDVTNITQGSISWKDIQIEQGLEATEYEGHVDKEILVKNDNGVFEKFYSEDDLILLGEGIRNNSISGSCKYYKFNKIVCLVFTDVITYQSLGSDDVLFSGLPPAKAFGVFVLQSYSEFYQARCRIDESGNVALHYSSMGIGGGSRQYYGMFIYETI